MKEKRKRAKRDIITGFILLLCIVLLAIGTWLATKWVLSLRDPDNLQWFQNALESLGMGGWFVLLAIQYVQIVVAFIPGGPIQVVAGGLYGPWGGLAVCVLGTVLASATVFYLVSRHGQKLIRFFVGEKDILRYKFLQDEAKLEKILFLLFLIPGTPKDALTYLFALTPIPMRRFMLLATLARLPAMLTSLFAGDQIVKGNWIQAGILFAVVTLISVLGMLLHSKIMKAYGGEKK